jgi:uncharacterized protein (DUF58 family)
VRLSFAGKLFLGVTAGVGLAAVNTGNNLLYLVLSLLLSLLLLSGILSEVTLYRLRLRRRLPERAFVGEPCLVEIEVTNGKTRIASYSVEVEDRAEGEKNRRRCFFLKVPASSQRATGYQRIPTRRGWLFLDEFRICTRFPFGLIEKMWRIRQQEEFLVYPAVRPISADLTRQLQALGAQSTRRLGQGSHPDGLRDYRDGDQARWIHWRRSAALARTIIRERRPEAGPRLQIRVDNRRPAQVTPEWEAELEEVISRAASLSAEALKHDVSVEVITPKDRSPLCEAGTGADAIWRFLALLEPIDAEEESSAWDSKRSDAQLVVDASGEASAA